VRVRLSVWEWAVRACCLKAGEAGADLFRAPFRPMPFARMRMCVVHVQAAAAARRWWR
jgi:hypothetical protein